MKNNNFSSERKSVSESNSSKSRYWLAQCAYWGVYTGLNLLFFSAGGRIPPIFWSIFAVLIPSSVLASHGLRYFYKGRASQWAPLKIFLHAAWLILLAALSIQMMIFLVLTVLIELLPVATRGMAPYTWPDFILYVIQSAMSLGIWSFIYLTLSQYRRRRQTELAYWKTQAQLRDTELQFLHNQINSHFLFNAMNNVRALILENPELARERLTQLASILRSTFSANNKDIILFSEELEIVEAYLDLESLQYENRMTTDINIEPGLKNCKIPPMLLQTLVENAVRHGIAHSPSGGKIEITGTVEDGAAVITIRNPITGHSQPGHGVGLENTRLRLEKAFPQMASLETQQQSNNFTARLQLPL